MPFPNKRIARAYLYSKFPTQGHFRDDEPAIRAFEKQCTLIQQIEQRTDEYTFALICELTCKMGEEHEFENQHYYTEGWLAAQRYEKRKKYPPL